MSDDAQNNFRQRDAASLLILGSFFVLLAVLVLIGSLWAVGRTHALIVNLGAGAALLIAGIALVTVSFRLRREPQSSSGNDS